MAFAFQIAMATLQSFLSNNPYLYHSLLTHTLGTTNDCSLDNRETLLYYNTMTLVEHLRHVKCSAKHQL